MAVFAGQLGQFFENLSLAHEGMIPSIAFSINGSCRVRSWRRERNEKSELILGVPFNDLKRNLRVGKYLPETYAAVFHHSFPRGG